MSKRRWTIWLGPPAALVAGLPAAPVARAGLPAAPVARLRVAGLRVAGLRVARLRVAGLPVLLVGLLVACAGARMTAPPGSFAPWGSEAPASAGPSAIASPHGATLEGRTWLAEGPRGWEAGRIGGRSILLARDEVGLATGEPWIVSAILNRSRSGTLVVRAGPAVASKRVDLGSLTPTATVIVGDHAYVSGYSFEQPTDPGILDIDLATATASALLSPSDAAGGRYLAASPDGSTLVSTLCDLLSDPEPAACSLTVVSLADGTAQALGDVPGGLLRATSDEVAVVAPQGPEPPGWLAGIDLATGAELWRTTGGEFGQSLMNERFGLIQQRTLLDGPRPRLVIEAIDMRTGRGRVVHEEAGATLGALWPQLSSDAFIVVGDDATGGRALGANADARARVRLVPLDAGDPLDVPLTLRSEE